ncbi:MAG TPA: hypothetical protein VGL46_21560 [Pseudonocardiaceae bacterium]|jgi:hypothetical protein
MTNNSAVNHELRALWPLSVPVDELRTWQRAAAAAADASMPLGQFATAALAEKLASGDNVISVWVDEPQPHEERFGGHWLIEPESASDAMTGADDPVGPDSWSVGIAETSHGRFVLALAHYEPALANQLHVFDTFEQLDAEFGTDERVGHEKLNAARERMTQRRAEKTLVIWRDI